jgi:hypothetical protein
VNELSGQLYSWLSGQHRGLRTFKALQLKLVQLAADHPEQRAMCRLLHGIVGNYVEQFDEAPLPSAIADRAYQRLLRSLANSIVRRNRQPSLVISTAWRRWISRSKRPAFPGAVLPRRRRPALGWN